MNNVRHSTRLARWISRIAFACVVAVAAPLTASADPILATTPSGLLWAFDGTMGFKFDVLGDNFLVTRLGFYDTSGDGLESSHDIGIWAESGGAPLATATLSAGTGATLEAEFRWVDLVLPLLLNANTSYVIGATFVDFDFSDGARDTALIDPMFSVVDAAYYAGGAGLNFPNIQYPNLQGFFGPNLSGIASVPDGGSALALLGLGMIGLSTLRRKLRK